MKLDSLLTKTKNKKLFESLFPNDLDGLVLNTISIDEFYPKVDNSAIVIAFFVMDEYPAQDLNRFIEFGPIDILDVEVSPAPDENGNYLVFVEINKEEPEVLAKKIHDLLKCVSYLVNITEWEYTTRNNKSGKISV